MNANTVSRKLAAAGFKRSSFSPVKGRGRSRRTDGFQVENNWKGGIEVSVRDFRPEVATNVHAFVIELGFTEVERMGAFVRYEVAA